MKFVMGMKEQMEGVALVFPMTIPTVTSNPPRNFSSTLKTLTSKIKKGSQKYRLILTRENDFITPARIE